MRPFLAPAPEAPLVARERPGFAVVIAAHQMAELVGGAIESALSQTVQPFEIIVCDDGSTDGTEVAVAPYLDRVTYVRRERGGDCFPISRPQCVRVCRSAAWASRLRDCS